jgi:3-hydroxymyristoyl/3-hydroxydecanoyl-(acyl carrier protein) dehydratase
MHFDLVDCVLERTESRIVTLKQVSRSEEYLQDHFKDFPVLPGVLMLEAMVQAARHLLIESGARQRMVLGSVRGLKYGAFVRPGDSLRVEVALLQRREDGSVEFRGEGTRLSPAVEPLPPARPDPGYDGAARAQDGPTHGSVQARTAVTGRFVLRPLNV